MHLEHAPHPDQQSASQHNRIYYRINQNPKEKKLKIFILCFGAKPSPSETKQHSIHRPLILYIKNVKAWVCGNELYI